MLKLTAYSAAFVSGFGLVLACSAAGDGSGGPATVGTGGTSTGSGGSGSGGDSGGSLAFGGSGGAQGGGPSFGGGPGQGGSGTVDPDAACTGLSAQADAAVDIIWAVDNSCSMGDEIDKIRTNINDSFLSIIQQSNLAWNLIMVSGKAGSISGNGLCINSPPAGPNCADSPPRFYHINCEVGSTNAFNALRLSFNGTNWGGIFQEPILFCENKRWSNFVRFQATKVFVVVTDDESVVFGRDFDGWLLNEAQPMPFPGMFGTEQDRKYIFNAIVGADKNNPSSTCTSATNAAEAPGIEYQQLAQTTGGVIESICEDDWSGIFNTIANTLVDSLGCEYPVPPPPAGETLNPNLVNVEYTPKDGSTEVVLQDTTAGCENGANGWQWNANQDRILLCGDVCDRISSDPEGKVDIRFGCATEIAVPK